MLHFIYRWNAVCNTNFGVWARFAFALNALGTYVCIFDDDTIPGRKWLENCLTESKKQRGLYGTRGICFGSRETYYGGNVNFNVVVHDWQGITDVGDLNVVVLLSART